MTDTGERSTKAQLATARLLQAHFDLQLEEHHLTGAHADRIDGLRAGRITWYSRVKALEKQAKAEARG